MAELAGAQHGVVSHAQLTGLGYSPAAIARGVRAARLHPLHRGVYAVGYATVPQHGACLAAVLSCGPGTVLSHASAAWLWGLFPKHPFRAEVTAPFRGHRKSHVGVHHSTILEEADVRVEEGVPTTAVPRTLLDVAATAPKRRLGNAVERAERLGRLDLLAIDELLGRSGRHRGRKKLALALEIYRDPSFSRSRFERLFLDLVLKANLPRPSLNFFVAGHEIDAYWERERFAVEVDGWEAHRSREAFERDPIRQEDLKLAGSTRFE